MEDDLLLIIGGDLTFRPNENVLRTVDFYSIQSGNISYLHTTNSSPIYWSNGGKVVHKGRIYLAGGSTRTIERYEEHSAAENSKSAVYNPTEDIWDNLPDMPYMATLGPSLFVHNETLFLAGGYYRNGHKNSVFSLDLNSDKKHWLELAIKLTYEIQWPNVCVKVKDRVFVIGKGSGSRRRGFKSPTKLVMSWRPGSNEPWEQVGNLNMAREQGMLCAVSDGERNIWVCI